MGEIGLVHVMLPEPHAQLLSSEAASKTSIETLVNLPWLEPRFKNGIGCLKRADSPSKTMNTLDDRLHGTWKMLCLYLNVFVKIVVKRLHKPLKLHTSRKCLLRESIRRKRLQFWQSDDQYLLQDKAPAYRSLLVKEFLAKIRSNVLSHPPIHQTQSCVTFTCSLQ
ncbi:hypothetical protein TNCV_4636761 [Trichonephila clavipes]|nr:hypothetical protein TNCV_4636761 [Trichonephila clavipes]